MLYIKKYHHNRSDSLYILPYPVGSSFVVGQGNCTDGSHSDDQKYAYDFDMPVGSAVIASRAGTVLAIEERFFDGNRTPGEENFVLIQHSDATVAGYYHLTQNGALIEVGDSVDLGAEIAISGDTGDSSEPHLHVEVLHCQDCDTRPINFRNTRAHTNGLIEEQSYEALPF